MDSGDPRSESDACFEIAKCVDRTTDREMNFLRDAYYHPSAKALVHFGLFAVLVALVPLGLESWFLLAQQKVLRLADLAGRGELLLISAGLAARGLGSLLQGPRIGTVSFVFWGGFALLMSLLSSGAYGLVHSYSTYSSSYDSAFVASSSIGFLSASIIASAFCVIVASWPVAASSPPVSPKERE